ncbi:MAG: phage tail sheath subtilisin-like domain-containing protein [Microcystis sp. LE18-22.4A]|nr:phage tail sheath subtilisin-like domain-containing protein [Microcystis sp. LE18-22.4A]
MRLFEPKTTLSLDEWNTNANNAAQAVKKAADGVTGEDKKATVDAVQGEADKQTEEPGKTVATSLLKIASDAAGKSGATADSVKATIDFAIAFNDIDPVKKAQAEKVAREIGEIKAIFNPDSLEYKVATSLLTIAQTAASQTNPTVQTVTQAIDGAVSTITTRAHGVKTVADEVTGDDKKPSDVVTAVQGEANKQTEEPGKTVATSLQTIAQKAAAQTEATVQSVQKAITEAVSMITAAATNVKTAADEVTGDGKTPLDVVAAVVKATVQDVADKQTEEPGKTVVQSLLTIAQNAASKTNPTVDDVKKAIDDAITNNTYETPPYPTATLTLKVYGPAVAPIKAALTPIQAAIDALFGDDGNKEASDLTVSKLITAATNAANSVSGSDNKKIAQQVAAEVKGNSLKAALDAAIQALIGNDILTKIAPYPEVKTALKTILGSSQSGFQAALDSIFDTDGNKFKTPQPTVADVSKKLENISSIKDVVDAAATNPTLKGFFDAVLAAIPVAAAAVPAEQILTLEAANPGTWGTKLTATVNTQGITDKVAENFASYGLNKNDLFNLTVQITYPNGTTDFEQFTNVTIKTTTPPSPNRLDLVLKNESRLVRVDSSKLPSITPPGGATSQVAGGDNGKNLSVETYTGDQDQRTGIYALEKIELFNIMCIPPDQRIAENNIDPLVYTEALSYCFERRAMLIVDPPMKWLGEVKNGNISQLQPTDVGIEGPETINAAVYFPRVIKEDPMMKNQLDTFSACGIIAGIYAATDVTRGVWKAPAGLDAGILGINSLELKLTDQQNGVLNPLGINCLRTFPIVGSVVWGDRTLRGADILDSDYKYVSVRRLTLYIEESLYQGTKWAVFEPNNENLWSALRLSVGSFMESLSRQGAFYSYQVVCDKTTTTQRDIDLGIVNVLVQFAPVKPAEFVVIQIQQQAGQTT